MPEANVVVSSSKSGDDPLFSTRLVLETASVAKSEIYRRRNAEETSTFGTSRSAQGDCSSCYAPYTRAASPAEEPREDPSLFI